MSDPASGPSAPRGDRSRRIAELERLLFGRPDRTAGADESRPAVALDREAALLELERLRATPFEIVEESSAEDISPSSEQPAARTTLDEGSPVESPVESSAESSADRRLAPAPVRTRLVSLAVAGVIALAAGSVLGVLTSPPRPAALERLAEPAGPLDLVRSESLRDVGLPLLDDGRILADIETATLLAFRAPLGTAERLESDDSTLGGNPTSPFGGSLYDLPPPTKADRDSLRRAEVCAWVIERNFAIDGRCVPLDVFDEAGLDFQTDRFGTPYTVDWSPGGVVAFLPLPTPAEP